MNDHEEYDPILMFFITFFFGVFGVHHFIRRHYGLGVLYFFTFGVMGIGWLIDTIRAFVAMFKTNSEPQTGHTVPSAVLRYCRFDWFSMEPISP